MAKKKSAFGDMGSKRMGMKGLELNGGWAFVKSAKKPHKHSSGSKYHKVWAWD